MGRRHGGALRVLVVVAVVKSSLGLVSPAFHGGVSAACPQSPVRLAATTSSATEAKVSRGELKELKKTAPRSSLGARPARVFRGFFLSPSFDPVVWPTAAACP